MFGKPRTLYGAFADRHEVKQEEIMKATRLSRNTVSYACSDKNYSPTRSTKQLLVTAIKQLTGEDVSAEDFWPI